jgi:acetyl/propionyl-CoA carboxylase alpha subunit
MERYVVRPRHVEVQIIADRHGAVVHVGDRDCTVQRRHQKLIEEAPAPDLADSLRKAMHSAAVALCRAEGYVGAGTVEFLVDPASGEYFFLEMNTRLQVEHGVSELVSGIDLVEAQLLVAAGRPLPFTQADVELRGHAIEARLAAEDAWDDFRPSPGRVANLALPPAPWLRADMGIEAGDDVQPYYDSMVGKLLVWGPTRDHARARLADALRRLRIGGVPTTAAYLADVLDQPDFRAVTHFTGSVECDWVPDPAHCPPAIEIKEEDNMSRPSITERMAALPRPIAVFGVAPARAPFAVASPRAPRAADGVAAAPGGGAGTVTAPMDGTVVAVPVSAGAFVQPGDTLVVIEAMKMEVRIAAPVTGTVAHLGCSVGDLLRKGGVLAVVDPVSAQQAGEGSILVDQ